MLEQVLVRLKSAGLKVNEQKSFFGQSQLEYLGYWITRDGVQQLPKKVQAIRDLMAPKTRKELHRFIGMVLPRHVDTSIGHTCTFYSTHI